MPEIKTCEQYILAKLCEKENEVEMLQAQLEYANKKLDETMKSFQELKDLIKDISTYNHYNDCSDYIFFSNLYESFDKEKYSALMRLVPKIKLK